jgi:hypothetical protein
MSKYGELPASDGRQMFGGTGWLEIVVFWGLVGRVKGREGQRFVRRLSFAATEDKSGVFRCVMMATCSRADGQNANKQDKARDEK